MTLSQILILFGREFDDNGNPKPMRNPFEKPAKELDQFETFAEYCAQRFITHKGTVKVLYGRSESQRERPDFQPD